MLINLLNFICDLFGLNDYLQAGILLILALLYIIGTLFLLYNNFLDRKEALMALRKIDRDAYLAYRRKKRDRQLVVIYLLISPVILSIKGYRAISRRRRTNV